MVPREEHLERIARSVRRCRLWQSRTHVVPGEGEAWAQLVFVGEAPGRLEDEMGRPFQGMAGREFDRLVRLAGLERERIFVTGIVKCRPPRNRRPRRDEMDTCRRAHLDRQPCRPDPQAPDARGRGRVPSSSRGWWCSWAASRRRRCWGARGSRASSGA
jgi:DNA polymerase